MRGKRFLIVLAAAALLASMFAAAPDRGVASTAEIKKIDEKLKQLKAEIDATKKAQEEAEKELERLMKFREMGISEIQRLEEEIQKTSEQIEDLHRQMDEVGFNLELTVQELAAAEERIATRDALIKARIRLMYMNGVVSYLDVLLSATSFTDFLDRMDALRSILAQDKEILAKNIQDKITVELKKADIEAQLEYVENLVAQTELLKADLVAKKEKKEVAVATYEAQAYELEEMTEEDERKLMELATEQQRLQRERERLLEEEKRRQEEERRKNLVKYEGGPLLWPLEIPGRETSGFGTRKHPITGRTQTHSGIDIAVPAGTAILAAAPGEVILAQWYGGYGNTVIIEHKEGFRTLYAHIRSGGIKVKVGDYVKAGDKIAEVGSTGTSTGNHLHFGVYVNNTAVDPKPYLTGKK